MFQMMSLHKQAQLQASKEELHTRHVVFIFSLGLGGGLLSTDNYQELQQELNKDQIYFCFDCTSISMLVRSTY